MLDKAGISYEKLYVEDNEELAISYGLKQAPTLLVVNGDSFDKYVSIPGIKNYISALVH